MAALQTVLATGVWTECVSDILVACSNFKVPTAKRETINQGLLMRTICFIFVAALLSVASSFAQDLSLVPKPVDVSVDGSQHLQLPREIGVFCPEDEKWRKHLEIFGDCLRRMTNNRHVLTFSSETDCHLKIRQKSETDLEDYMLEVNAEGIQISVSSLKGLAHGTATLLQLIGAHSDGEIPYLKISDQPKLPYRNFMIDMGRNPHSLELLKETVDLLWYYKVDSVQLHLTDDQRFAFPSKAFPKLWDGKITAKEFSELDRYALLRGVTIIPELEVPGHSGMLRKRYPDVFGKSSTDLARDESALHGIKTLLDEMIEVFPSSPYIHVGGDEAFGVPEELQRDLINQLHDYLKSKGRQTIVWEGPRAGSGDNKVNTEVIHINWRTINYPADQMLNDGYRVINAAWDPLYIVDHYPRTNFTMTSPQHIYENLSVTTFKHVNPGIPTFAEPVEVKPTEKLIGFCMPWWEGREENYFSQNVPRLIAFAEVAWNPGRERDYLDYERRLETTEAARHDAFYPVAIEATNLVVPADGVFHNQTEVSLSTRSDEPAEVRYTLDGSLPTPDSTLYQGPFLMEESKMVRAAQFISGEQVGLGSRRNLKRVVPVENLALGKPVTSSVSSGSPFSVERLTDGGIENLDFYLGYPAEPEPISVTIDLEEIQQISRIVVYAYSINNSFEKYHVEVSADGEEFAEVASRLEKPEKVSAFVEHNFDTRDVRYVRIRSHGNKGYVFDSFSKLIEVQVFE